MTEPLSFYDWVSNYLDKQHKNLAYWTQQEPTIKTKAHIKKIEFAISIVSSLLAEYSIDCDINQISDSDFNSELHEAFEMN